MNKNANDENTVEDDDIAKMTAAQDDDETKTVLPDDGSLEAVLADAIEDAAMDYFGAANAAPEMDISSAFGAYGINYRESFRDGSRTTSDIEFLGEETEGS